MTLIQLKERDADSELFEKSLAVVSNGKLGENGCCGESEGHDETMKYTSNFADQGKLSGFSTNDPKINTLMDDYTGADNDEFMKEIVEDYGTKGEKSAGNPDG